MKAEDLENVPVIVLGNTIINLIVKTYGDEEGVSKYMKEKLIGLL